MTNYPINANVPAFVYIKRGIHNLPYVDDIVISFEESSWKLSKEGKENGGLEIVAAE